MNVQAEAASVLSMASDLGWTVSKLEKQIEDCKGDINAIFQVSLCGCF